jgi:hypothetical protein
MQRKMAPEKEKECWYSSKEAKEEPVIEVRSRR